MTILVKTIQQAIGSAHPSLAWTHNDELNDSMQSFTAKLYVSTAQTTMKARRHGRRAFWARSLAVSYFRMGAPTLSSALSSFTSEFGKGSGGSHSLWPPGNSVARHATGHVSQINNSDS